MDLYVGLNPKLNRDLKELDRPKYDLERKRNAVDDDDRRKVKKMRKMTIPMTEKQNPKRSM